MSKFLPTLNIWDQSVVEAIHKGQLKLQTGQYLRCGTKGPLSRFVAYNNVSKTFNLVHGGSFEEVNKKFNYAVSARKRINARLGLRGNL